MKRLPALRFALVASALLLAACQSSTVASRIEAEQALFASWPAEVQTAVREGRIERGFTPEQVRVAWGEPDHTTSALSAEAETEKWIYERRTPALSIGLGIGGGSGRVGLGTSVGTTVGGWTRQVGTVIFKNGVVDAFERSRDD